MSSLLNLNKELPHILELLHYAPGRFIVLFWCFSVSKKGIKSKKAHDGLRAKPSPQHTGMCASWMRGGERGIGLLWQGHGLMSFLSVARGREESLHWKMVVRGIHSLGLFSYCIALSCAQLKGLGACKTYLDTIMCKERLCICFCGQLKACGFAPVLIFPHQQSKCSLLTVVVAFTKQFCHMKETQTKKCISWVILLHFEGWVVMLSSLSWTD